MITTNNENSIEVRRLARIAWHDREQLAPQDRAATAGNLTELIGLAQLPAQCTVDGRPVSPSDEDVVRARALAARIGGIRVLIRVPHELDEIVANNEGHSHTKARLERTVSNGKVHDPARAHSESARLHALLEACPIEAARRPQ